MIDVAMEYLLISDFLIEIENCLFACMRVSCSVMSNSLQPRRL